MNVNFGIKTLLLLLASFLFLFAVFSEKHFQDLIACGLLSVALAFLLTDIGWDRKYAGPR